MYLEKINSPKDVKKLSIDELKELIVELRTHLLKRLSAKGGHIDHELTNINLMFKYYNLYFLKENEILFKIEREFKFKNLLNTKISFIPFSEKIKNLTLSGFKYNIEDITLKKGDSLCMSNIIESDFAKITFEEGKILCVIKS